MVPRMVSKIYLIIYHYFSIIINMWHACVYILNKIIPHPYHYDTEKPTPDMWFGVPQNSTTPKNSHTNAHTRTHKWKIIDNKNCLYMLNFFLLNGCVTHILVLLLSCYNTCKLNLFIYNPSVTLDSELKYYCFAIWCCL